MSYTLKIKWERLERDPETGIVGATDETTLFIPAKEVRCHHWIDAGRRSEQMKEWDHPDASYFSYVTILAFPDTGNAREDGGRLIQVIRPDGETEWYLASRAWLLNETGATIERIAP